MDLNPWLAEMMRERRYPFDAMNASVDKKCWIENQSTCEFTVDLCVGGGGVVMKGLSIEKCY